MNKSTPKAPAGRTKRTPISQRNVLSVTGLDPAYSYRIVNDTGDRIAAFQDAGYELVSADEVRIGDKRVNSASPEGSNAQVSVGAGQKAFLMKIHKEWYEEDQEAKQKNINELEKATLQQALSQNESKDAVLSISR